MPIGTEITAIREGIVVKVEDSYDQNFLTARLFVENNMATLRKFSVSISYFVAAFTNIRIFRQHPK